MSSSLSLSLNEAIDLTNPGMRRKDWIDTLVQARESARVWDDRDPWASGSVGWQSFVGGNPVSMVESVSQGPSSTSMDGRPVDREHFVRLAQDALAPSGKSASRNRVLVALASFASDEGVAFPAIGSVADRAAVSRDTVKRILEWGKRSGWLAVDGKTAAKTVIYQLCEPVGLVR